MSRRVLFACLLALTSLSLVFASGAPVQAEDEPKEGLVTRIYNVRAITSGRPDFVRVGEPRGLDDLADEENPLFGAESSEVYFPLGQTEELIEQIRQHVEPDSWDSVYGADMAAIGEGTLVVRSFADIADKVAAYLGALERQELRTVAVELRALRLSAGQAAALRSTENALLVDDAKLAAVLTETSRGPELGMLGYERHRFMAHTGSQQAYLADYDVEVAEKAKIADPIVSVHNLGLAADVRPILAPDAASCLLTLSAFLARMRALRPVVTGDELLIEAPDLEVARVLTKIDLPVDRWALVDGQQGAGGDPQWMFLVRVRAGSEEGLSSTARGVALESPASRPARSLALRSFDVAALAHSVQSALGREINLVPSNFTPPEPPELEEPAPIFPVDVIAELMTETVAPATWELKGAMLDVRNGRLYVRNAPYVLDAVDRNLKTLRKEFLAAIVMQADLVTLPRALATRIGLQVGATLGPDALAALEAALETGEAERRAGARVTTMAGARNAVSSGRRVTYLSDFEVELAKEATIANPVMQEVVSGSVLDVQAAQTAGGGSVHSVVRFTYGKVTDPMRFVETPHGRLEAPELSILRTRAVLRVPLGQTVVTASSGEGPGLQVLLLRAEVARTPR